MYVCTKTRTKNETNHIHIYLGGQLLENLLCGLGRRGQLCPGKLKLGRSCFRVVRVLITGYTLVIYSHFDHISEIHKLAVLIAYIQHIRNKNRIKMREQNNMLQQKKKIQQQK